MWAKWKQCWPEILETERLRNGNGKLSFEEEDLTLLLQDVVLKYKDRKPGVELLGLPETVKVKVDQARIRTVIQNLIENALKFSDKQKETGGSRFRSRFV